MSDTDTHAAPMSPTSDGATTTNPRLHRLQRQDAKSRKTFKIKRHHSTIKGSIMRSATVKGNLRYTMPGQPGVLYDGATVQPTSEICASLLERIETRIAEGRPVTTPSCDVAGDMLLDSVIGRDETRRPACDSVDCTTAEGVKTPSLPMSTIDVRMTSQVISLFSFVLP